VRLELSMYGLWGKNFGLYRNSVDWCSERLGREVEHLRLCRDYATAETSWRRVHSLKPGLVLLPGDECGEAEDEAGAQV
jgi:hypothetical protein